MTTRFNASSGSSSDLPNLSSRLKERQEFRIALCLPFGGTVGIWGPSSLSAAELAATELNQNSGIAGLPCGLEVVNATDDDVDIESRLDELIEFGEADAVVGMHTSSVRKRVISAVGGRVPYVYTTMYEGGEHTPGVFAIGETTQQQLRPAMAWMHSSHRVKRWAFVGNDYLWPRASNCLARRYVADLGDILVGEYYRPLGTSDYSQIIDDLHKLGADIVLLSLIGQDQVEFNRAFGAAGLHKSVARLSCTIAENELLAIGARNTDNLFVASGYFAALETDENMAFKERYHSQFGERAPMLNAFGQSTYEGVHFLSALLQNDGLGQRDSKQMPTTGPLKYQTARGGPCASDALNRAPVYLARADGYCFSVLARL